MRRGKDACDIPRLNARRFEEMVVGKIRSNVLTEGNIRALVKVVDEQMDGMAREQRKRLETIEDELEDVKRKLGRIWHFVETTDIDMADASDRIKEHRERQERLEDAAADARAILSQRRVVLDDVNTIAAYAQDMSEFLNESELTERRAFIETFVKEIVAMPADALLRYTIPISQSTPKTELLVGGRSEEFWVGNEAEASSQLVGDVEGRLHPEERPRVELWPSQQFLFQVDIFLQSFPSIPTVRLRQHVASGLGNPVRELAVPAHVSAYGEVPRRRACGDRLSVALEGKRQWQAFRDSAPRSARTGLARSPSPDMVMALSVADLHRPWSYVLLSSQSHARPMVRLQERLPKEMSLSNPGHCRQEQDTSVGSSSDCGGPLFARRAWQGQVFVAICTAVGLGVNVVYFQHPRIQAIVPPTTLAERTNIYLQRTVLWALLHKPFLFHKSPSCSPSWGFRIVSQFEIGGLHPRQTRTSRPVLLDLFKAASAVSKPSWYSPVGGVVLLTPPCILT